MTRKAKTLDELRREFTQPEESSSPVTPVQPWSVPTPPPLQIPQDASGETVVEAKQATPAADEGQVFDLASEIYSENVTFRSKPTMKLWMLYMAEQQGTTLSAKLEELVREWCGEPPKGWQPPQHLLSRPKPRRR